MLNWTAQYITKGKPISYSELQANEWLKEWRTTKHAATLLNGQQIEAQIGAPSFPLEFRVSLNKHKCMGTKHAVNNLTLHLSPASPWERAIVQARQQMNTVQDILHSFLCKGSDRYFNCLQYKSTARHNLLLFKDLQR